MKEVYIIVNYDNLEVLSASTNYNTIQENILDMYMDDLYYDFLWNVNYHGMTAAEAYSDARENIDDYYRNYMVIDKVRLEED